MPPEGLPSLIVQLDTTQRQLNDLLDSVADQDWRPAPDEWSFRFIAGHLAINEQECFLERINGIASGREPRFAYYSNDDRDFSALDLQDSLRAWHATRQKIFAIVQGMPEAAWSMTAIHATAGRITLMDILRSMLEHDREHLANLKPIMKTYLQFH